MHGLKVNPLSQSNFFIGKIDEVAFGTLILITVSFVHFMLAIFLVSWTNEWLILGLRVLASQDSTLSRMFFS